MRIRLLVLTLPLLAATALLQGCSACYNRPSNPEQVREATANATATVKNDAKAVAQGVRDGLRRSTSDKPLDLNTASKGQLSALPGLTDDTASRIVANRPYRATHDLLDRHLVTRAEYDRIASLITVE